MLWKWTSFKGDLRQNISILKSSYIGHKNSLNIVGFQRCIKKIGSVGNFNYFLVPENMSPLHVRSKVCMASFHLRSEVGIAHIHVRSKVCQFASHMDGSNADFAPHMKEAMQTLLRTWTGDIGRFRDQFFSKIVISANFQKKNSKKLYLSSLYNLCDHI